MGDVSEGCAGVGIVWVGGGGGGEQCAVMGGSVTEWSKRGMGWWMTSGVGEAREAESCAAVVCGRAVVELVREMMYLS